MSKQVLISPIITEKMTLLQEQRNQYAFEVGLNTSKIDISNAIEKKFNVKVLSIRTIIQRGKSRTQFTKRGRFTGFKSRSKKAIITLGKDQKIDLFEST